MAQYRGQCFHRGSTTGIRSRLEEIDRALVPASSLQTSALPIWSFPIVIFSTSSHAKPLAITIKISSEELSRLHADSIAFADGSGYIAEMAVYHELHCIKRIRRHFYLDRYYPDMSPEERVKEDAHIGESFGCKHYHIEIYNALELSGSQIWENKTDSIACNLDHCLEYWREATMCRGDTAITTFRWVDGFPFSRVDSEHECVNWERLDTWARERMVNMSDYTKFIH